MSCEWELQSWDLHMLRVPDLLSKKKNEGPGGMRKRWACVGQVAEMVAEVAFGSCFETPEIDPRKHFR